MKNKALNTFYENLLEDVGVVDGGSGLLSYHRIDADDKIAITIEGKRLTLPTRENLKLGGQANIMFHPTSEQLMSGPSPVLDALREYIMLRITTAASSIARAAMTASQSTSLQKKCKGKGNELLRPLTGADAKMESTLEKILDKVGMTPETRMYNIFLVASGSKENPRGLRTAKVSFPILDDAHSGDETEFFGIKMPRKTKDKPALSELFYIIFDIDPSKKNPIVEYTSTLHQAPYFHSLLTAFKEIANHQNVLIDGLSKAVPNLKDLKYKLDWIEEYEDFENFVKKVGYAVPLLPGNKGKSLEPEDDETEEEEEDTVQRKTKSSWKDLRDSIVEEEPHEEQPRERTRTPSRNTTAKKSTWRELLAGSDRDDRDDRDSRRGVRFGDKERSRGRRGGFDGFGDRDDRDDRDSRRGSYRDRQYDTRPARRGSSGSWRDLLS